MEDVVAEVREGASGASELLRAFYGFVVQQIRYVAWEFGVHGYQPYNVSTILARRFGDCKDKAILLNAMLGGVGVEGYPVLLYLGNIPLGQDLTLPMVNHFNHCISYVPGLGEGGTFLDGTAEFHGSTELPGADRGRSVLVVREGRAEVHSIPEMLPRENQTTREFTILLSTSGTSRVEGKIRATGDFAAQARQQFLNPEKSPAILESTFSDLFGSARLRKSRFFDARDLESSPEIVFDLDVQGIVRESGAHLETPALLFPVDLSSYVGPESRRFDLFLPPPQRRLEQTTFVLPEGARLLEIPAGIEVAESFGSYRLSFERQGERDVRVIRDLSLSVRRIPAGDYPAFRSFCLLVSQGEERRLRFQAGQ
jgi:hypothetical protein